MSPQKGTTYLKKYMSHICTNGLIFKNYNVTNMSVFPYKYYDNV